MNNLFFNTPDCQYDTIVKDILHNGGYVKDRTGTGTLKRFAHEMRHRPNEMFPILTKKKVAFESAKKELFWIYQDQSNDVNLLKEKYGVKVWDEWANDEGTIGKAYGFQVKKHNQIDRLIEGIKSDPYSRRHRIQLWSEEDASEMELEPCAFMTLWYVDPVSNELNMTLIQRSGDMGLGIPFNMVQYAILQKIVAHCTGYKVGEFVHLINDAHVYVNHINPLKRQLSLEELPPRAYVEITTHETDFYKLTPDDIKLRDYQSYGAIPMEVSV